MPVLFHIEFVGKGPILCNRALCHTVDTIHLISTKLPNPVPVHRAAFLCFQICNMDSDSVTPARLNQWTRECIIEDLTQWLEITIWRKLDAG